MGWYPVGGRTIPSNILYSQPSRVSVPNTANGVDLIDAQANSDTVSPRYVRVLVPSSATEGIFITFDATAPTTANGLLLSPGGVLELTTAQRVRAICQTGPVVVHVLSGSYV